MSWEIYENDKKVCIFESVMCNVQTKYIFLEYIRDVSFFTKQKEIDFVQIYNYEQIVTKKLEK